MDSKVVLVTPELASAWLSNNTKNRPLSDAHVERLASVMSKGEWSLNGESVVLDDAMHLLDGQHRLHAVIKSGQPQRMVVVTGVTDPNAFQTFDNVQRQRTATQITGMLGTQADQKALVGLARYLTVWNVSTSGDEFASLVLGNHINRMMLPQELARAAHSLSDEFTAMKGIVFDDLARRSASKVTVYSMTFILHRINPTATAAFWEKIKSGIFTGRGDPCLQIRDRIMAQSSVKGRGRQMNVELMAILIKAWNAFIEGREVGLLRLSAAEKFPTPNGWTWGKK